MSEATKLAGAVSSSDPAVGLRAPPGLLQRKCATCTDEQHDDAAMEPAPGADGGHPDAAAVQQIRDRIHALARRCVDYRHARLSFPLEHQLDEDAVFFFFVVGADDRALHALR